MSTEKLFSFLKMHGKKIDDRNDGLPLAEINFSVSMVVRIVEITTAGLLLFKKFLNYQLTSKILF